MKKIFTLITMAVMAMTAMAEDYTGTLVFPWAELPPPKQRAASQ